MCAAAQDLILLLLQALEARLFCARRRVTVLKANNRYMREQEQWLGYDIHADRKKFLRSAPHCLIQIQHW